MKTKSVYMQIKEQSLPHIEAYHDDLLKHDRTWIRHHPGQEFIHFTRECGTHVCILWPFESYPPAGECVPFLFGQAGRDHILKETMSYVEHYEKTTVEDPKLILHHKDGKVKAITLAKARQIVTEYQHKMHRLFREDSGVRV